MIVFHKAETERGRESGTNTPRAACSQTCWPELLHSDRSKCSSPHCAGAAHAGRVMRCIFVSRLGAGTSA